MDHAIVTKLLELNAEFYQTFAKQFSDTRQRIQPGIKRILDSISTETAILDLGCGNGKLARELIECRFRGEYTGIDFSEKLLEKAREGVAGTENFHFFQGNLAIDGWQRNLYGIGCQNIHPETGKDHDPISSNDTQTKRTATKSRFPMILAFAALHHIPGRENHLQIMRTIRDLLTENGRFIHSNWQFLNSERLQSRIHPWEEVGLKESDVDSGDFLLDWRRGGFGLRYVHHFSESELNILAAESGFRVVESFFSDGKTGDLGLYQIWEIAN